MGSEGGGLRQLLDELVAHGGVKGCAFVARSGVPLAHALPEAAHVDNFATMSATLVGAVDVIFTGLHKESPRRIVIDADGSVLVAQAITEGAFVVALLDSYDPKLGEAIEGIAARAKGLLGGERPAADEFESFDDL